MHVGDYARLRLRCVNQELTHPRDVLCLAFVDEARVVTGCEDGRVRTWDVASGELLRTYEGHQARVKGVVAVRHGSHVYLVSASSDGTILLWRMFPAPPCMRPYPTYQYIINVQMLMVTSLSPPLRPTLALHLWPPM